MCNHLGHFRHKLTFVFLCRTMPCPCLFHIATTFQSPFFTYSILQFTVKFGHVCRLCLPAITKHTFPRDTVFCWINGNQYTMTMGIFLIKVNIETDDVVLAKSL